ncbi:hypothetical protein ACOMHN_042124 [Nucella lapillus]
MESRGTEENVLDSGNPEGSERRNPSTVREPLKFSLMLSGYDLFPVDFSNMPLDLRDSVWFRRDFAWRGRNDYKDRINRSLPPGKKKDNWPRAKRSAKSLLVMYDTGDANIFTKDNLREMQEIEDSLVKVEGYKDFCQMSESGSCMPALSVLRFFDGTMRLVDPVFYDPHFDNIVQVLYKAYTSSVIKGVFRYALSKVHTINSTYVHVTTTRSIIPLGHPIKGMSYSQGQKATLRLLERGFKPLLDRYLKTKQFTFLYYNEPMMIEDAKRQGFQDMKLAIGSMIFIFGFILFHTRSLWMTTLGVFSILCSFVETNLLYRVVLGYRYFGFFHVVVMFIILGIGADDLFVFWDAWKASELRHFPTLAHRLDETYRKSTISMFVTSLTTMLAFLASAISPLLAISSFGVFSAILVIVDYISVITFFPTIVVFYHLHFDNKSLFPCCKCWRWCSRGNRQIGTNVNSNSVRNDDDGDDDEQLLTDVGDVQMNFDDSDTALLLQFNSNENSNNTNDASEEVDTDEDNVSPTENSNAPSSNIAPQNIPEVSGTNLEACATSQTDHGQSTVSKEEEELPDPVSGNLSNSTTFRNLKRVHENNNSPVSQGEGDKDIPDACAAQPEHRWLVVFFRDYYLRFVTHKIARWVILAAMVALIVFFAVSASRLKPDNQQVGLFKESHHYTRAFRLYSNGFADNMVDYSINLVMIWGVKEKDLSPCPFSHYNCHGREVFDDSFNPSTEAAQRSLMNLCDTLHNFTDKEAEDFKIRRDVATGRLKIECFMQPLRAYLKNDARFSGHDVSLPWNKTTLDTFVTSLKPLYNVSAFNSSYKQYLDVPVNYWLWDGYRQKDFNDLSSYKRLLGEQATSYTVPLPSVPGVRVGNRLKYIVVIVLTTLQYETLSYVDHIPVVDRWEQFMQSQLRTMPPEMKGGFQITEVAWHWLYVQKSLVTNAVTGVILGVSLTLPILVLSTCNVLNGLLATFTICSITVCVIGVIPLAGWKLGVLVSLNMCLVVGLAVDYVVHLAEGYHMSHARDRRTRLKHSLERMGISVFSGACTTLGASVFMLFAQIQFFYQFGIFMFCTIGFSLLFSLGFYVTLMGIVGPEGSTGNILVPVNYTVRRFKNCWEARKTQTKNTVRRSSAELMVVDGDDDDDMIVI